VERDDRATVNTFFADAELSVDAIATLGEHVAHHARVKRLGVGDRAQVTNGRGSLAAGTISAISKTAIDITVEAVRTIPEPFAIHLRAPIADRDRMLLLAEKATELGIASWQSVRFKRSMSVSPRGEGSSFAEKLRARMIAALEQSGGAWLPTILDDISMSELQFSNDELPIVLDASGDSLAPVGSTTKAPVVLIGPEGGIEPDEMAKLIDTGWRRVRLAPTTLRFETAGIAAVSAIRSMYHSDGE
jgi:16S rRNA (uracil1498-N3)-methyltransferase